MRPVALPAAGGLVAAMLLFSMIAPVFTVRASSLGDEFDIPTVLSTQAGLAHSRGANNTLNQDVVVDVFVDGNGRMIDYTVPAGQVWQNDPKARRCIENWLILTKFTPATKFGQPASGMVRIYVSGGSELDVQG